MLSREAAEKRLKTFHIKNWEKDRLAALGALPRGLCEIGRFLFGRDAVLSNNEVHDCRVVSQT